MNEPFDDMQALAGEYVLGTQDLATRQALAGRFERDAVFRAAVLEWERRLLPLATLAEAQQPSPQLWPRIADDLPRRTAAPRADAPVPLWERYWDNLRFWRGLAAGGIAAAGACAVLITLRLGQATPEPAYMVVLVGPQDKAPGWVVQASLDRDITLTPLGQTALPQHKALQFWTKGKQWNGPVSLGLVQPGQSAKVAAASLPPLEKDQLFEITMEPERGSPTGKPSGPVLYIGRAVKVM